MARSAADLRANYDLLIANGLCPHCKGTPKPGRKHCQPCIDHLTRQSRNWRKDHPGADARFARAQRERRLLDERCGRCGKRCPGRKCCEACVDYMAARQGVTRPMRGACTVCAGKAPGRAHNRRTCPWRFRVDVVEYATARRESA